MSPWSDAFTILRPEDVTEPNVKNGEWITPESNDDSSKMPPNCNGSNYNSLLSYTSKVGDAKGALAVSLYRPGFTTYRTGEVQGTLTGASWSSDRHPRHRGRKT